MLKLKQLKEYLQDINSFSNPKEYYEQYQTNYEVAADISHYISHTYDLRNKTIADIGCGTGILGISLLLNGADEVTFYEIDKDAIEDLKTNLEYFDLLDKAQIINMNVFTMEIFNQNRKENPFDIVITNPPFGIQSQNSADVIFLEQAIKLSNNLIFSMHKSNTYSYLKKFYESNGIKNISKHEIKFDIAKTYKFHKEKNKVINVCLIEVRK